jgi:hypothetical protein
MISAAVHCSRAILKEQQKFLSAKFKGTNTFKHYVELTNAKLCITRELTLKSNISMNSKPYLEQL